MATKFQLQNPPFGSLTRFTQFTTEDTASTPSLPALINGIFVCTPGSDIAVTLQKAEKVLEELAKTDQDTEGSTFTFTIVNEAPNTHNATLTVEATDGTKTTIEGNAIVAPATSATFAGRVRIKDIAGTPTKVMDYIRV